MPKIIPRKMVLRTKPHVRWNWQPSPDNSEMVRYHLVVVNNKDREQTMDKMTWGLRFSVLDGTAIDLIKTAEGKVLNTNLRWLYHAYDSPLRPKLLRPYGTSLPKRLDPRLVERKRSGLSIVDYIERIYDFTMKP